jgi:hypothetical protein
MKMRNETIEAASWASFLVACIVAIFFPESRIAGIIALTTWAAVIIMRSSRRRRPKHREKNDQAEALKSLTEHLDSAHWRTKSAKLRERLFATVIQQN